jgi:hypothetical protein
MDTTRQPVRRGWTTLLRRRWVQLIIAVTAGFALGAAGGGTGTAEPAVASAVVEPPAGTGASPTDAGHTDQELDAAVAAALEEQSVQHADELAKVEISAATAISAAAKEARQRQRAAVKSAVAKAKQQVRRNQARQAPAPTAPAVTTDQRYSYCYEVQDAGLGPYVRGVDPEYDWYRDNDGDGTVCE